MHTHTHTCNTPHADIQEITHTHTTLQRRKQPKRKHCRRIQRRKLSRNSKSLNPNASLPPPPPPPPPPILLRPWALSSPLRNPPPPARAEDACSWIALLPGSPLRGVMYINTHIYKYIYIDSDRYTDDTRLIHSYDTYVYVSTCIMTCT